MLLNEDSWVTVISPFELSIAYTPSSTSNPLISDAFTILFSGKYITGEIVSLTTTVLMFVVVNPLSVTEYQVLTGYGQWNGNQNVSL